MNFDYLLFIIKSWAYRNRLEIAAVLIFGCGFMVGVLVMFLAKEH